MDSNLVILLPRLRQTVSDIEKYSSLLGEYGDTPELRKRLAQLEGAARGGIQEIEKAILDSKLKVGAAGGSQASQRAMLKVEDAFVVDKKNAQAALERSAARRRAAGSKPRSEGGGGGGGGGSSSSGAGGGSIVIEMKGLTAVDAAIAEESQAAALAIARDAAEINKSMKQLSAVIGEQEEAVAVVEANTATALAVTEKGAEDLVTAQAYQRAYRCKWVILTTLILLFVGIMILLHFQFQII